MLIQIVRFTSGLSHEEVHRRFVQRSHKYREVPGLLQKYYVRWSTGEHGGVYVWDSLESLEKWKAGNLSETIAETFEVKEEPTRELADVMLVLHESFP